MEDTSGNVSYLNPRDPSIYVGNSHVEIKRTNLLSLFGDETEENAHVSKSEKVKVYLRIKPTKRDAALMMAPPQASETYVLCLCLCVCVCLCEVCVFLTVGGSLSPQMSCQVVDGGDSFHIWKVAVNVFNKQLRTASKGWSCSLGVG
jgi:hypothetical protein